MRVRGTKKYRAELREREGRQRTKEDREVEDRAKTRTTDKGHIKTGIYILNTRGSQDDKKQGKSEVVMAERREKDKPPERPTDTNGRTGSETD